MKQLINILLLLFVANIAIAQAPQAIPYQAVARNSSGAMLASTNVSVRFTIRDSVATGTIRYRETHSVTTNPQGLFTTNVGSGTPVTGTFSNINWATNAKFLQVEIDPAGGSSYIDMGTQQMMSVPYALNSASVKFRVSQTGDTVFSGSGNFVIIPGVSAANCTLPSAGIITGTATVTVGSTTTLSNATTGGTWVSSATGIATVGSTGIVTGVAAGTATISYTLANSCGSAVATQVVTVNAALTIGASYGGGVIAYILQPGDPGYIPGETHGLIATPSDLSSIIQWGCYGTLVGTSTTLGTGAANTAIISAVCGAGTAARLCTDLVLGGYNDWYLPSLNELQILYNNSEYIGGFTASGYYWSSSEYEYFGQSSWLIFPYFLGGDTPLSTSKEAWASVRAVRSFSYPEAITGTSSVCVGSTSTLTSATPGGTWSSSNTGVASVSSSGVVAGVSSGTTIISYTATGSFGPGTTTRVITVDASPNAGTISGTATVIAGGNTILGNATTGGIWSSSDTGIATVGSTGIVTGVAVGTSTISYSVTNCFGNAIATRVVTVNLLTIGAAYGGGKIAYILKPGDPGYIAGETHGLIAAPSDQSTGIQWGCYGTYVGGTSNALGSGAANTATISAACGTGTAASLCADLVLNGYSDWYLPSREELEKLYTNRMFIGGFSTSYYWNSSEYTATTAWSLDFNGSILLYSKLNSAKVRAVRSFSFPEAITGTMAVCVGSTSTLSSATIGGSWSSSNAGIATVSSGGVVSGVTSGTAIISYTATESFGIGITTRVITVNALLPTVGTIIGADTVTAGSTTTLINTTSGGTWTSSNTAIATVGSAGVVTGVAAGTASISYTVTNGCGSAIATYVVTVNGSSISIAVGSTFGGGVIAYILQPGDPGYIAGETHGLIAAPSDQSTGIQWSNGSYTPAGSTGMFLGTGMSNTNAIVAVQGSGSYAAKLCYDLVLGGYSDWYLPSKDELNKLYVNRIYIGEFTTGNYWTSSEWESAAYDVNADAYYFNFSNGSVNLNNKNNTLLVRAVRSF